MNPFEGLKLIDILPQTGFIKEYFSFACELTDSPEHFHILPAVSLVAVAVGNGAYIPFGAQNIYPIIWFLLLAPSSVYHKSSCLRIAEKILMGFQKEDGTLTYLYPPDFTRERILEIFEERNCGLIIWDEFTGALSLMNRDYNSGIKDTLTSFFNRPEIYSRRVGNKHIKIKNPCVSIASTSSLSWLTTKLKPEDVSGGFLARFLLVPAREKSKFFPIPPEMNQGRLTELRTSLNKIALFFNPANPVKMGMEKIAKPYEAWQRNHEKELLKNDSMEKLGGFFSRLSEYLLKIAMLFQISENREPVISVDNFERAKIFIDCLRWEIKNLVSNEIVLDPKEKEREKLIEIISKNPGIDRSKLMRNSHLDSKSFHSALLTLQQTKEIENKGGGYFLDGKY